MTRRRQRPGRETSRARGARRARVAALNRVVVIGASTGGVGALCTVVQDLPAGLPCAIMIDDGHIRVSKGPRENYHRPSVDVLFRSAARAYGPRVVGIVLTGAMEDGASGIFSVKAKGGITVVHDPREAMVPDMPLSAMNAVQQVDYCLPIAEMAPLIVKLAHEPVPVGRSRNARLVSTESETLLSDAAHPLFVCPECDGPLRMFKEGKLTAFSCKVGHRFTLDALSQAHSESLERALWIALRVLEDRAAIQRMRAKKCTIAARRPSSSRSPTRRRRTRSCCGK